MQVASLLESTLPHSVRGTRADVLVEADYKRVCDDRQGLVRHVGDIVTEDERALEDTPEREVGDLGNIQ